MYNNAFGFFPRDPTPSGIPNVTWKPCTVEHMCYLNINNVLKMEDGKLFGDRLDFWKNVIKKKENVYRAIPVLEQFLSMNGNSISEK